MLHRASLRSASFRASPCCTAYCILRNRTTLRSAALRRTAAPHRTTCRSAPPCPTLHHRAPPCTTLHHPAHLTPPCTALHLPAPPCGTLQHHASPCTTLHRPAPPCTTSHHTAPHRAALHHPAPPRTALHRTAPPCTTLHRPAPPYTTGTRRVRARQVRCASRAVHGLQRVPLGYRHWRPQGEAYPTHLVWPIPLGWGQHIAFKQDALNPLAFRLCYCYLLVAPYFF